MTDLLERLSVPRPSLAGHGWLGMALHLLVHLRPHWQLVLSPIFLWGLLLSGAGLTPRVGLAFVVVHLFLYGGVTAYNSAYDRDTGPVSGLLRPPPVTGWLLPFSVWLQVVGLAVASILDLRLAGLCVAYMLLSVGYSHPRLRWKGSPIGSAAVIFVGQGLLGFAAGWVAGGAALTAMAEPYAVVGMVGAAGITLALFPLGHLFQLEEDRRRGDTTLAIALGGDGTFRFAQATLLPSAPLLVAAAGLRLGVVEAAAVAVAFPPALAALELWRRRFDARRVVATYRTTMVYQSLLAAGFGGFILLRL